MDNSTFLKLCRDSSDGVSEAPGCTIQFQTINKLRDFSQILMNSALLLSNQTSTHACIVFTDRALEYMLKALYMKEINCTVPPCSLTMNNIVQVTSQGAVPDLDALSFIYSIHYLARITDDSIFEQIKRVHLMSLLKRTDDLLVHFSSRLDIHESDMYQPLFSK